MIGIGGYSSHDARFVSLDPSEYHSVYDNLYIYVNNNGINNSDLNGFYPDSSKGSGGNTSPQDIQYQFDSEARLNGMNEAQLKQLNDSINNTSVPYFSFYGDHCERWHNKFYFQNNSTIYYTLQRTSWEIIDGTIWVRHCGVVLKFRNGSTFYIDDGGIQFTNGRGGIGEYRISTPSDIPMNWKENGAGYGSWDYLWSVINESLPPNFIDPGI